MGSIKNPEEACRFRRCLHLRSESCLSCISAATPSAEGEAGAGTKTTNTPIFELVPGSYEGFQPRARLEKYEVPEWLCPCP